MPQASRKHCDYRGCDRGLVVDGQATLYIMEEGNPTRAKVVQDLLNNIRMAHELPVKLQESQAEATRVVDKKLRAEAEKLRAEQPATSAKGQGDGSGTRVPKPVVDKWAAIPIPKVYEEVNESNWSFFRLSGVDTRCLQVYRALWRQHARRHYSDLCTTRERGALRIQPS